ncbi:ATP-binding protein [Mucisphaera sp.]|uniref:ATP-binding protein n=1 Tax=Mucisphaera sp. TaxID=2913024 RepID=UPI003D0DF43E
MRGEVEPMSDQIKIPSRLSEVAGVQDRILSAAGPFHYSEKALFALKLCLDEAVTNAIRHGNGSDPSKQVTIDYAISEEQIRVTICDEGPGFDPGGVPDPTLDENLERPCGRGVMLMAAYMTEVTYNDRGNCVTLVKSKDCTLPSRND